METKKCKKCLINKSLDNFYFNKSNNGYGSKCKLCHNEPTPEKREHDRIYSRQYYQTHKKEQIERAKQWRLNNPEKANEISRKSRHKLENKAKRSKHCSHRRKTDTAFRILFNCRKRLRKAVQSQNSKKTDKTINLIGCSASELKIYLEAQFTEGMSWDNYGQGKGKWHIDHIIPCAAFDLTKEEEQRKCFHYSNLQPLWEHENISKNDKLPNGQRARELKLIPNEPECH